jgi:hypothetical protein
MIFQGLRKSTSRGAGGAVTLALLLVLGCTAAVDVSSGASQTRKSISAWVSCDGRSDDSAGVAAAFAAASHAAFTLLVDCPVRLHVGSDIAKTVFIDDDTSVEFAGAGKLIVDNILHPAFVIANAKNVSLTNWNVEYDGSLPVDHNVGGYEQNGHMVSAGGVAQPAGAFSDKVLTPWLSAKKRLTFDRSQGNVNSFWPGPTNLCAIFYVIGDTSNLQVEGLRVYVPPDAGAERFVPVVFSFQENFKSNQAVNAKEPRSSQSTAVPHDIRFSNIVFDGTYMGWVGGIQNATFENIQSHRYADLQDATGGNVGGAKKWFAPPHLFYFSYAAGGDPALFNKNIQIRNVVDDGPRVGTARDKGGMDTLSGYALSLKLGCVDCAVDNYKTTRPDGFMDVLPSDGLTVSNVDATYDSSFLNDVFPGWRFPASSYKRITFKNISFKDTAATSNRAPIGDATQASNASIVFQNVQITLNRWAGKGLPVPNIAGSGNDVVLDYTFLSDASRLASVQRGNEALTLLAMPAMVNSPRESQLSWTSKGANACTAAGDWQGGLSPNGTRSVALTHTGSYRFTISCQTTTDVLTAGVPVAVGQ